MAVRQNTGVGPRRMAAAQGGANRALPEHWTDEFHEPDGTHPQLIVHADRRSAMQDRDRLSESDAVDERRARTSVAEDMFFRTGENVGAALLSRHLLALYNRDGCVSCVDDVSGETLCEEGVRAARALEMEYFIKMGVYEYVTRDEYARSGRKGKKSRGDGLTSTRVTAPIPIIGRVSLARSSTQEPTQAYTPPLRPWRRSSC